MNIDPRLFEFATQTQKEYLQVIDAAGSMRAASRKLGCRFSVVQRAYNAVKRKAVAAGYAPEVGPGMNHPLPSPLSLKGTSTLYDERGSPKLQWVKTKLDNQQAEETLKEYVEWLVKDAKGVIKPTPAPKFCNADLLACYPIGDPHFGMYSWAAETGDDFDADIAEKLTRGAIDRLVNSAPPAETGLIVELGDFFHADNMSNSTPRNNNPLDTDSRWARVMLIGLKAMKYVISRALQKHKKVIVWIQPGNHDPHSSFALAMALHEAFAKEKRVEIDLSPAAFRYFKFGNVLIGCSHGDNVKAQNLAGVMAADRSEDWGKTKFRYWYCGHVHHVEKREFHGVLVEYFRTLAGLDAWAAGMGFRSGRDMNCIVHHKDYGEIERHRCDVAMLKA